MKNNKSNKTIGQRIVGGFSFLRSTIRATIRTIRKKYDKISGWLYAIATLILAIGLIVFVYSNRVYLSTNEAFVTEKAVIGTVKNTVVFDGVFIRDEQVINYNKDGAISYQISDGGKAGIDSVIAYVYSSDEQIQREEEIQSLEQTLAMLEKLMNKGIRDSATASSVSQSIDQQFKAMISFRESGNYNSFIESQTELLFEESLFDIMKMRDEEIENSGYRSYQKKIQKELDNLKKGMEDPIDTVESSESGYFISYVDGYEKIFSMEDIENLTVEKIRSVNNDTIGRTENVLGKMMYGNAWYIAGVIDNSSGYLLDTDNVYLQMEGTSRTISAEIEKMIPTENLNETIVVFKSDVISSEFLQARTVRVELSKASEPVKEGIIIPQSAIRTRMVEVYPTEENEDGEQSTVGEPVIEEWVGVYIKVGDEYEFRKIDDSYYECDDYYLSPVNSDSRYVKLYDDIIIEGVPYEGDVIRDSKGE